MQSTNLDLVFGALADPTRRGMLAQLASGETNVSTLAEPYAISQPAVSRHLRVLEQAGMIRRTRRGREHLIKVDPRPIEAATTWVERYAKFWVDQFDAMDAYLKKNARDRGRSRS